MDHLEEIRSRLGIEELVSSYVQLKKAGRNLKGLCPFHSEKSPSFIVSPDKGIAWCFGCQKGGDIFKFTQLVENIDFGEAVKMLAERAHVELPRSMPKEHNKRLRLIEANEKTTQFYESALEKAPIALEYLAKRGMPSEVYKKYRIGYSPDSFDALKSFLSAESFNAAELVEGGLLSQRSMADKTTYDRFRNRLMFPIFDHQGAVVGFSGRILEQGEPKYINSPETPAYNKSAVVYGLNFAKEAIKKEDQAILMEGFMDVIAAHTAGTLNAVATSGTALTPLQLKLIARFTKNVAFCFDQDEAGLEATRRAIELAQLAEMNIKVIMVPNGKDPDECIKNDPEAWQVAAKNPVTVMDFFFAYARRHHDPKTMEGKRGYMQILLPVIKTYASEVEQGEYLNRLAVELGTDPKLLWNDLKKWKPPTAYDSRVTKSDSPAPEGARTYSREEYLLGFILKFPELYSLVYANLVDTIAMDPQTERFYKALKQGYTVGSILDLKAFLSNLTPEDRGAVEILSLLIDKEYPDFEGQVVDKEVMSLIREINRKNLYKVQKEVEYKIRASIAPEEKAILLTELSNLINRNG
jgi:DNA primase